MNMYIGLFIVYLDTILLLIEFRRCMTKFGDICLVVRLCTIELWKRSSSKVKKFSVVLLTIDKPNFSGRIFTREVVEKAIEEVSEEQLIGSFESYMITSKVCNVAFLVSNFQIRDEDLWADIELLDTPSGRKLKEKKISEVHFSLVGGGLLSSKYVTDFDIIGVEAIVE